MSWLNWKDVGMMAAAAFAMAFCLNLGDDAYLALSGMIGLCRG